MERKLRFNYEDSNDLLCALEKLASVLPGFGVKMDILDGGDGYEEVRLTKMDEGQGEEPRDGV